MGCRAWQGESVGCSRGRGQELEAGHLVADLCGERQVILSEPNCCCQVQPLHKLLEHDFLEHPLLRSHLPRLQPPGRGVFKVLSEGEGLALCP